MNDKAARLIDTIKTPYDIRVMGIPELEKLSVEIRDFIINTVSKTGGHLASSLGVVELTLALHYVFDTPEDKLVWDVGHQCYCHKILTGRKDLFHTLRQYRGISGFPKPCESHYDTFMAGHASTSVSAALGFAHARRLKGSKEKIVAVIGDGSLTGGLAYEGLNNIAALKDQMLVILNDNTMAISKSVGSMANYLSKILSSPLYNNLKRDIEGIINKMPFQALSSKVIGTAHKFEELFKGLLVPGLLFEELGLKYIGPIDGHNINILVNILKWVKEMNYPVLLHVVTKKGCGYKFAEENPEDFHGISSFHIGDGTSGKPKAVTFTDVFSHTITEEASYNSKIVAITAAMKEGTGLSEFAAAYPDRFFDVGIAEGHAVTFSAGLAREGFKPYVAIYSTFLQRALDHIIHDVALQNLNVVFCIDRGGLVGEDGPTHHGVFDLGFMRMIPNMTVLVPKDEHELRFMLQKASTIKGPVSIRYPRGRIMGIPEPQRRIDIPGCEILRQGWDGTIIAAGPVVYEGLKTASMLSSKGIELKVVSVNSLKPLPVEILASEIAETSRVITLEENSLSCGFGSTILEFMSDRDLHGKEVLRLGVPDAFVCHGAVNILREDVGITAPRISKTILEHFYHHTSLRSLSPDSCNEKKA